MTINDYLNKWLVLSGLDKDDFSLNLEETENHTYININIPEEKAGFYIDSRGETMDAIQQIIRITFRGYSQNNLNLFREGFYHE